MYLEKNGIKTRVNLVTGETVEVVKNGNEIVVNSDLYNNDPIYASGVNEILKQIRK